MSDWNNMILKSVAWFLGALVIAALVAAFGNHAKSAERDELAGIMTFVCSNQNAIEQVAAAAERGNKDRLKELHKGSSCKAKQAPVKPEALTDPRFDLHLLTENAGGATVGVYSVDVSNGTAWIFVVLNPDYAPSGA